MSGLRILYPHQLKGLEFLISHRGALLADEMGLGKTSQAIAAAAGLRARSTVKRVLCVAPQYLLTNWSREIEMLVRPPSFTIVRGPRAQRERLWNNSEFFTLVGYESASRDFDIIANRRWDLIIFDEIQKLKNPSSELHKKLAGLRSLRRWGLTGIPVENNFHDLVAIFSVISPGLITDDFLSSPDLARRRLLESTLRRKLVETIDLPQFTEEVKLIDLGNEQRRSYDEIVRRGANALRRTGGNRRVLQSSLRDASALLRAASFDPKTGASAKLDFLLSAVPEFITNEKVVIFSCFPNIVLKRVAPHLRKYRTILIDGSTSPAERVRLVDVFQHDDDVRIALVSVKAGGTGLNLTAASRVIHFDSWWTAAAREQANGRAFRIGQERRVLSTVLIAANTIEETLAKLVKEKGRLARRVLEGYDFTAAALEAALPEEA